MLDASKAHHPVAFFLHGIGDALLVLPALRALSEIFRGRLTFICERPIYNLFFKELSLQRVIGFEPESLKAGDRQQARLAIFDSDSIASSVGSCDLFLSLVPWRSRYLDRLIDLLAPEITAGLAHGFDIPLVRRKGLHAFDHAFELATLFDPLLTLERFAGPPELNAEAADEAKKIANMLPASSRILAVHNETRKDKVWPPNHLRSALQSFVKKHRNYWALILDSRHCPLDDESIDVQIVPCEGLALDTAMCLIGQASLFLGVDSCMLHAADLLRVPSVGLFGPTSPTEFGSRLVPHCHVSGDGSMAGVSIADVVGALDLLRTTSQCSTVS
jgi:ADP-heptose:LPS heptosyltransferase